MLKSSVEAGVVEDGEGGRPGSGGAVGGSTGATGVAATLAAGASPGVGADDCWLAGADRATTRVLIGLGADRVASGSVTRRTGVGVSEVLVVEFVSAPLFGPGEAPCAACRWAICARQPVSPRPGATKTGGGAATIGRTGDDPGVKG